MTFACWCALKTILFKCTDWLSSDTAVIRSRDTSYVRQRDTMRDNAVLGTTLPMYSTRYLTKWKIICSLSTICNGDIIRHDTSKTARMMNGDISLGARWSLAPRTTSERTHLPDFGSSVDIFFQQNMLTLNVCLGFDQPWWRALSNDYPSNCCTFISLLRSSGEPIAAGPAVNL